MREIIILSFIIYHLSFVICLAQRFRAGLYGGIATTQVHGDDYSGFHKAGLYAGGFASKYFKQNKKWEASFEISYIQKGSRKLARPDIGDYKSYSLSLDYAEVPVLLRYHAVFKDTAEMFRAHISLEGGLAFGALVRFAEADENGPLQNGIPFRKTDFSAVWGINYHFTEKFLFNVRSINSILPVRRFDFPKYYPRWFLNLFNLGYYNNVLAFSLHYWF